MAGRVRPFVRMVGGHMQRVGSFIRGVKRPRKISQLNYGYRKRQSPGSVKTGFWMMHSLRPDDGVKYVILEKNL